MIAYGLMEPLREDSLALSSRAQSKDRVLLFRSSLSSSVVASADQISVAESGSLSSFEMASLSPFREAGHYTDSETKRSVTTGRFANAHCSVHCFTSPGTIEEHSGRALIRAREYTAGNRGSAVTVPAH